LSVAAVSFVGDSGVGKTTLLERVVSALAAAGVRVAVVKHSGGFDDPDSPAKDSARLRRAGARRVVLGSPERTVVFWDHAGEEPPFEERLRLAGPADIVLVESYAAAGLPAIEVLRSALPRRVPRLISDPRLLAVVADFDPPGLPAGIARFRLEEGAGVARFLMARATLPSP
jgi:molybdopterin-guanine dinucleotide biosynthesis adapter protein